MKWSTLVVCLIASFLELKSSNGIPVAPCSQPSSLLNTNVDPTACSTSIVSLLTTLCSSSTLNTLPSPAIVSIVNTLSATPQLFNVLPPSTLASLLSTISSSPSILKELSPIAVLLLLAAISSGNPSSISSIPPSTLYPLLKTLSFSGLLPPSVGPLSFVSPPTTVCAQLSLPPPLPQVVVPGPSSGPMYISLPKKPRKPSPIIIPSGPPPSIVVSIPQPCPAPPLIMPNATPGPIVINEDLNTGLSPTPIVLPAPQAPNIYFTTHPSKSCSLPYTNSNTDKKCSLDYNQPQFEMPKVYALPPGISPSQYLQSNKKC